MIEIIDAYGDAVLALPENARCRIMDRNPENLIECPTSEFDGDCCPEMCSYYTEDD